MDLTETILTLIASMVLFLTVEGFMVFRDRSKHNQKTEYEIEKIKQSYDKLHIENKDLYYQIKLLEEHKKYEEEDGFSDTNDTKSRSYMRQMEDEIMHLRMTLSFLQEIVTDLRNRDIQYVFTNEDTGKPNYENRVIKESERNTSTVADEIIMKSSEYASRIDDIEAIVSNILHITRTPVSGIKIASNTIEKLTDDSKIHENCSRINEYSNMIEKDISIFRNKPIINDDKTEELSFKIKHDCDLISLTSNKKINLNYELPNEKYMISVDKANYVMLCASCILENAMYYSKDNGNIDIALVVDKGDAELSITNYGSSIDMKNIEKIFMRGYSSRGSSGYGLNLAKHIAEDYLNADITVLNDEKGVIFTIRMKDLL